MRREECRHCAETSGARRQHEGCNATQVGHIYRGTLVNQEFETVRFACQCGPRQCAPAKLIARVDERADRQPLQALDITALGGEPQGLAARPGILEVSG